MASLNKNLQDGNGVRILNQFSIKIIVHKINVANIYLKQNTPLHIAISKQIRENVEVLLNHPDVRTDIKNNNNVSITFRN
jgi:hypothetical protein